MSNNKWDKENIEEPKLVVLESAENGSIDKASQTISGSSTDVTIKETIKVDDAITIPTTGNIEKYEELAVIEPLQPIESLIVPIEAWPNKMTSSELKAYKEYQRSQFPELFEPRNVTEDRFSEVPFLKLTKPARIFASFLDAAVRIQEMEKRNKTKH